LHYKVDDFCDGPWWKAFIFDDWASKYKTGFAVWRCSEWRRTILGGWCRWSLTYPQHRVTNEHKPWFVRIDNLINPVVARPVVSIPDHVLCHLSILPAQLKFNILTRAATSEVMTEFIIVVIAITLKHAEALGIISVSMSLSDFQASYRQNTNSRHALRYRSVNP
jgi:hypothetical protein